MNEPLILFIDDEAHIRAANRQTLDLAGLAVETFEMAEQALPQITPELFGVVVSDIRLPKMNGIELLKQVQEIDPDLPLILISGHADIDMAVTAIRDGAYDFIEKPFGADRLVDTIRRALDKRRLTLENRQLRSQVSGQINLGP
ncbi:MAG: sigma-54-dependent Fis family transcriptional regulator, partial [Thiotrichales bacterium]|nr:sigma-54-dependent Fis family transcriptional regulator [Thiotrichales bacterium]